MLTIILKVLLVALLAHIVVNLGRALFAVVRKDPDKPPMSHYIGQRVLFSALVMLLVVLALSSGVLEPNPRPY